MDASFERHAVLDDGRRFLVRFIRPTDEALLRAGFERLSAGSRYGRFFTSFKELPPELLRNLIHVDGVDHCAIVAVTESAEPSEAATRGLAVARFVRSGEDPRCAEVAVTVADDVQGLGLASRLLAVLAEAARARGIETFVACSLADNAKARRLLAKLGAQRDRSDGATAWYHLPVARVAAPPAGHAAAA